VPDATFREDTSWVPKDHGLENAAILRHFALNLLNQERTTKRSIKSKRLAAALSSDYLLKTLSYIG
jgi:hypothetical protein